MTDVSRRLVATADKVFFVTTTPVPTNRSHPTTPSVPEGILDASVATYNVAAAEVRKSHCNREYRSVAVATP